MQFLWCLIIYKPASWLSLRTRSTWCEPSYSYRPERIQSVYEGTNSHLNVDYLFFVVVVAEDRRPVRLRHRVQSHLPRRLFQNQTETSAKIELISTLKYSEECEYYFFPSPAMTEVRYLKRSNKDTVRMCKKGWYKHKICFVIWQIFSQRVSTTSDNNIFMQEKTMHIFAHTGARKNENGKKWPPSHSLSRANK